MTHVTHNVAATVRVIIAEQLWIDVSKVKPDDTLKDLGADSLDLVELLLALEDEFSIEIADEEAEKFRTVADIIECVKGKTGG